MNTYCDYGLENVCCTLIRVYKVSKKKKCDSLMMSYKKRWDKMRC